MKPALKVIKELETENARLHLIINNIVEENTKDKNRLLKALKEQGYEVGPFVDGPDITEM